MATASKAGETDVSLGQDRGGQGPRGDPGLDPWAATSLGDRALGLHGRPGQAYLQPASRPCGSWRPWNAGAGGGGGKEGPRPRQ